jgi:hypothetical protein
VFEGWVWISELSISVNPYLNQNIAPELLGADGFFGFRRLAWAAPAEVKPEQVAFAAIEKKVFMFAEG